MHTTARAAAAAAVAGAAALATGAAASAAAAERVHIEVATSFVGESPFTSNLDGCESGVVEDDKARVLGSARFGIFNGFKVFHCEGGGTFTLRLHAKFTDAGSAGTWAFVGGGLRGNGTLVGTPVPDGIYDVFDGTSR